MINACAHVCVCLCVSVAVTVPVQPDWLFSRPSLTMDFVTDATQPHDPVSC